MAWRPRGSGFYGNGGGELPNANGNGWQMPESIANSIMQKRGRKPSPDERGGAGASAIEQGAAQWKAAVNPPSRQPVIPRRRGVMPPADNAPSYNIGAGSPPVPIGAPRRPVIVPPRPAMPVPPASQPVPQPQPVPPEPVMEALGKRSGNRPPRDYGAEVPAMTAEQASAAQLTGTRYTGESKTPNPALMRANKGEVTRDVLGRPIKPKGGGATSKDGREVDEEIDPKTGLPRTGVNDPPNGDNDPPTGGGGGRDNRPVVNPNVPNPPEDFNATAERWAQAPGYEWMRGRGDLVKAYREWALQKPEHGKIHASVWAKAYGHDPRTTTDEKYSSLAQIYSSFKGYEWVKAKDVYEYQHWVRSGGGKRNGVDFVDWAKAKGYNSPQAGRSGSDTMNGMAADDAQRYAQQREEYFRGRRSITGKNINQVDFWKQKNGGGDGGGGDDPNLPPVDKKPPTDDGGGGDGGASNKYLDDLKKEIMGWGERQRNEGVRALRAKSALTGMQNSGAFLDVMGDYIGESTAMQNREGAKLIFDASESEQGRLLQKWLGSLDAATREKVAKLAADAQLGAASTSAGASNYAADMGYRGLIEQLSQRDRADLLGYNLGIYGIDRDLRGQDLNMQQFILSQLSSMSQADLLALLQGL